MRGVSVYVKIPLQNPRDIFSYFLLKNILIIIIILKDKLVLSRVPLHW